MIVPHQKCNGVGLKDGRGWGPHGTGYYVFFRHGNGTQVFAPFGPNCERLPPPICGSCTTPALGEVPTADEYVRRRKTLNLVMGGVLGVTGLLLGWALLPKKHQ